MKSYRFGAFVLDVRERRLVRDGQSIPLAPKAFDTLVHLVERHGHLVRKDELLEAVWAGAFVEEGSLPRTIHVLRKALTNTGSGDHGSGLQFIETVPTKGYRFIADVTPLDDVAPAVSPHSPAPRSIEISPASEGPAWSAARESGSPWRRWAVALTVSAIPIVVLAGSAWSARNPHERLPGGLARLTRHTSSGAAYARYQSARVQLERHLDGDVDAALAGFDAAIRLDPDFAAAYAGKADARFFRYWDTGSHDDIAQARLAIDKALALDPDNAYAHSLRCRMLATYDWELGGAETECRRALALDPANDAARREMAFLWSSLGRRDLALQEIDAAVAIAPTSFNKQSRGMVLYFSRRFDEAIAQLQQVEATDAEYAEASRWIARCLEQMGDHRSALEAFVRYREAAGAPPGATKLLRRAFEENGWPGVLRASLPKGRQLANLETAGTYALLGDADATFAVLESMISARRVMIVHIDSDARLDPVRADPRFEDVARRVGLRAADPPIR